MYEHLKLTLGTHFKNVFSFLSNYKIHRTQLLFCWINLNLNAEGRFIELNQ